MSTWYSKNLRYGSVFKTNIFNDQDVEVTKEFAVVSLPRANDSNWHKIEVVEPKYFFNKQLREKNLLTLYFLPLSEVEHTHSMFELSDKQLIEFFSNIDLTDKEYFENSRESYNNSMRHEYDAISPLELSSSGRALRAARRNCIRNEVIDDNSEEEIIGHGVTGNDNDVENANNETTSRNVRNRNVHLDLSFTPSHNLTRIDRAGLVSNIDYEINPAGTIEFIRESTTEPTTTEPLINRMDIPSTTRTPILSHEQRMINIVEVANNE